MEPSTEKLLSSFRDRFYRLVQQIPAGRVSTYGALAEALGDKRAARAVGKLLNQNPDLIKTPCHRVVRSNGELGGYAQGEERKRELLEEEGLEIKDNQIVDFGQRLFSQFDSNQPLNKLRQAQLAAKRQVELTTKLNDIELLGGIDASYSQQDTEDRGYVALYLEDKQDRLKSNEKKITTKAQVDFPYIPTYLAFRELPLFLQVLYQAKESHNLEPDLLMVDGNGYLHPNKFGLACHLGVEADLPTIGVSKSLLCGQLDRKITPKRTQTVIRDKDNNLLGHALVSSDRAQKPIYVSPGHLIDFDQSLQVVKNSCEYKIPRPIRQAHLAANEVRKRAETDQ